MPSPAIRPEDRHRSAPAAGVDFAPECFRSEAFAEDLMEMAAPVVGAPLRRTHWPRRAAGWSRLPALGLRTA